MEYIISHEASFKYLEVYSLRSIDAKKSLFVEFRDRISISHNKRLTHLLACIQQLGKRGALIEFFRNEQSGSELLALPKKNYSREPVFLENEQPAKNNLRLYCHRLNERVIFLFSGDLKTNQDPLKCPNVRPHFLQGQEFCKAIDNAIKNKDIKWIQEFTDIDCDDDLILYV